jgi:uncharacterized protein YjiK
MKRFIRINIASLLLAVIIISCGLKESKKTGKGPAFLYDLQHPDKVASLSEDLNEISGITYTTSDSSLYSIEDEDGLLFKINVSDMSKIEKWDFGKEGDYEDVAFVNNAFYVLKSNGNITSFRLESGNVTGIEKYKINAAGKNEFESLYYDDQLKKLVILCKDCELESKSSLHAWSFDPVTHAYEQGVFNASGKNKTHIKPSAAAIHPQSGDLYILASVNKLLVVADRKGNILKKQTLNPSLFKQPEGIAFSHSGDMFVSNERNNSGSATILVFKSK